jgi:putative hydrolase of the HAD superfamily
MPRYSLLIDADDTLWENNIYFEQAFEQFVEILDHSHLSPREVRDVLDEIEIENIRIHGYGAANFGRNLQQCFRVLAEKPFTEGELDTVMRLSAQILEQPMALIDGVEETLAYLAERHELILFSKGHAEEQHLKVDRSGLRGYFHDCRIVREKDTATYKQLIEEVRLDREQTWMVGNSPKSDIWPALGAGLGAVLVPHPHTWRLEHAEMPEPSARFHRVERFTELKTLF